MIDYKRKKLLFFFIIIVIAFFFSTFEFYHTDKVLQLEDNCPIGFFEKNSVFFIDYSFIVFFIFLFVLLFSFEFNCSFPVLEYIKHRKKKRAPPYTIFLL